MEIVRLAVVEREGERGLAARVEVDLRREAGDSARRHRLSAFHELVVTTVRQFRAPESLHGASRRVAPPWQRSPADLVAFTIASLHRAAGLTVECEAAQVGADLHRITLRPAGSRATRRAVELAVEALRGFQAGRPVDLVGAVLEIQRLHTQSRWPSSLLPL